MAKFSGDTVEKVKDAADIVEIVSAHTDLRRAGTRFSGLCPFHDERTPSFSVDPVEKLYYCFGCGEGGDVFGFLQAKEGLSFPDAVESLAERYGIEIEREEEDPRVEARRRRRARLGELMERTSDFYVKYLEESPKAARAREYLAGRGLEDGTLRDFGVGFAPSAWDQVLSAGQRAGFTVDELHASGLVQKGSRGVYDRFRARITFPLRDARGRVVGFGARALGADSKPKYLNSPEGELFHKGRMVYALDKARGPIAKAQRAIVVEGYTDVLALHQAGIEEAVAIMGTAITPDQLTELAKAVPGVEIVLALDADRAGQDAMLRAQKVASGRDINLKVARMQEGKDPADMLAEGDGLEKFKGLVGGAIDLPAFQVETALSRAEASASGRERVLTEVAPVLHAMQGQVGQDELIRKVASGLDTEPSLVAKRVESAPPPAPDPGEDRAASEDPRPAPSLEVLSPRQMRERALLAMCIAEPAEGKEILAKVRDDHLSSDLSRRAVAWLRDHLAEPMAELPREDEELVSMITQLVMSAQGNPVAEGAMELNLLLLEQRALEDRIAKAREAQDYDALKDLSEERAELVTKIAGAEQL